jgi:hypothetical protein
MDNLFLLLPALFVGGLILAYGITYAVLVLIENAATGRARPRPCPRNLGFCRACGYDLRGTPTRCPECGERVEE